MKPLGYARIFPAADLAAASLANTEKNMYVFELIYPGDSLLFENGEVKREIEMLLDHLESKVTEAAIALSMYEASPSTLSDSPEKWKQDAELRRHIDEKIRRQAGDDFYKNTDRYRFLTERQLRQEKIKLGILPDAYIHKIPFIHAHTFVYAVDAFGKFLEALSVYEHVPEQVRICAEEFNELLPSVRKIRNSALHVEDRLRGYGSPGEKKKGRKMQTNGFLGISNLEYDHLCYTIDDGSYQKVAITPQVLKILVRLANKVLASFDWQGSPRTAPHY